jgi:hypothetical protein
MFPPRLSARAMFWWGVGLVVGSILAEDRYSHWLSTLTSPDAARFFGTFGVWLGYTIDALRLLGVVLVGLSFAVRALAPAPGPDESDGSLDDNTLLDKDRHPAGP